MSTYKNKLMLDIEDKLSQKTAIMPGFYQEYVEARSAALSQTTLLAYTYKFKIFLNYLKSNNSYFGNREIYDYTLDDLSLLTYRDILDFKKWLRQHIVEYSKNKKRTFDSEKANVTLDNYMACLSSVWSYFKRTNPDTIKHNPVEAIERAKRTEKPIIYLEDDEKKLLVDGISSGLGLRGLELCYHDQNKLRDETICRLLLDTGIRVSELVGIDLKDINFPDHSITVTRKGGNIEKVYIPDILESYLEDCIGARHMYKPDPEEEAVFLNRFGKRLGVRGVEKLVKKYTEAILPEKNSNISPHKLRSTFATTIYESTKNIEYTRHALGQKSLNVVLRYAKSKDIELKENRNILYKEPKSEKLLEDK